ncbi:MAG: hypothetical protein WCC87_15295 [Candidatus Korobacteraceae bacterium]
MKRSLPICLGLLAISLVPSALTQDATLARLNREASPDIPRPETVTRTGPAAEPSPRSAAPLADSALSRLAAEALFVHSNLSRARTLAGRARQRYPRDGEALFVRMEVAALQADDAALLDAAVRLCELGKTAPDDPRVRLAAVRIRELAANAPQFRSFIPRLRSLLSTSAESWPELDAALLNAAMDGVPGLDPYAWSRAAGILTDWRMVGPLGRPGVLDLDQSPIAPADDLAQLSYQNHAVENFQFPDGRIRLPDYLPQRGIYYAASHFASLTPGTWRLNMEGGDAVEIFVDGQCVLRQASSIARRDHVAANFEVVAGPHRVLVKFVGSVPPRRISITPFQPAVHVAVRSNVSAPELAYELAAERYVSGEYRTAVQQIAGLSSASQSAALQFLLAQSLMQLSPAESEAAAAWSNLLSLAPSALAADVGLAKVALRDGDWAEAAKLSRRVLAGQPASVAALEILTSAQTGDPEADAPTGSDAADIWSRRLLAHPSCAGLQAGIRFYRAHGQLAEANAAQQKLDGCAPESIDYAQSLAEQGRHLQAAQSLQRLLAAAPLNRSARSMLVRELQLAGDDAAAQRAAAEWLRVAPNAENYHRLAASEADEPVADGSAAAEFYLPYRRDAMQAARQSATEEFAGATVVLLDDHVAIARPDGSVSLYVHTATRWPDSAGVDPITPDIPRGAQLLELRAIKADGSVVNLSRDSADPAASSPSLAAGDVLDEEYVVHYAGDGGVAEHPEVFQFVFGSFDRQVLSARFVALTPAENADRGVVIVTGDAPRVSSAVRGGMLARVWQKDATAGDSQPAAIFSEPLAIVRIVEQDNGWAVPSKAEHQRRIETIHRGPRFEESALRFNVTMQNYRLAD